MSRLEKKPSAPEQKAEFDIFRAEARRIEQQGILTSKHSHGFRLIYEAAKNPDKTQAKLIISELLASKKDISWFGYFMGEETPVYRLAKEGNTESVDFLMREFPINLAHIFYGYGDGGHLEEGNKLLARYTNDDRAYFENAILQGIAKSGRDFTKTDLLLSQSKESRETRYISKTLSILIGYAAGKHVDRISQFLNDNFEVRQKYQIAIAQGYTESGYIEEVYNLLTLESVEDNRIALLVALASSLDSTLFLDETTTLHILVLFKPEDQKFLVEYLKNYGRLICKDEKQTNLLLSKAAYVHQLMFKHQINFDQALSWIKLSPPIHFLLTQGLVRSNKQPLPENICRLISTFLVSISPIDISVISGKRKKEFLDQLTPLRKKRIAKIMSPLEVYSNLSFFSFSHHHLPRAKALIEFAKQTIDLKEIKTLLHNQKSLFEKDTIIPFQSTLFDESLTKPASIKSKKQGKFYSALTKSLEIAETNETPTPK